MKKGAESKNIFPQETAERDGEAEMTTEENGATVQAEDTEELSDGEPDTAGEAKEPSDSEPDTAEDTEEPSDSEPDTAEDTEEPSDSEPDMAGESEEPSDSEPDMAGESEEPSDGGSESVEEEKLLFRDTTPELVESAVHSLSSQGLVSVQYRKEEETYAVYSSPEEFEKARELLIEILQDEAENIRDRARTLEAKKTLREIETTELAPGFRPEKTPREKYEDANSTAIAFLVVGAVGIVFVVLEYFGIFFSLNLSENVRYIFYPTMLVMFAAFLVVGFVNLNQAAKWKEKVFDEDRIMNNVREYAEHELIHEIRTMMAERVVNELNMEEAETSADSLPDPEDAESRPDPEDALAQLENLFDGGFSGAEESAGMTALSVDESEETEKTTEVTEEGSEETDETAEVTEKSPEETEETTEVTEDSPEKTDGTADVTEGGQEEAEGSAEETAEISDDDRKEMDRAFNDYYVMEQEIQFRLIKEFPDLPANLLVEATEYVIKLMEESDEEDSEEFGFEEESSEEENSEEEDTEEEKL